jgi:predicted lipoprotein
MTIRILILLIAGALLASAQDNKKPADPAPKPLSADERIALMDSHREALQAQNALQASMIAYYEAQAKSKTASDTFTAKFNEASKKAGCQLNNEFVCQPAPAKSEVK